ncbi:hypothetical protein [Pseudonocardia dioxanivorans]|uniref:hypothetical protein n=1 Tax=Pseudonocardia dioxanivorans TaxID=240495 RepID=UPI00117D8C75|nr:hypothetical protein [Pseudonocardia dioxanivorans]
MSNRESATKPVRMFPATHSAFQHMTLSVSVGVGRRVTIAEVVAAAAHVASQHMTEVEEYIKRVDSEVDAG